MHLCVHMHDYGRMYRSVCQCVLCVCVHGCWCLLKIERKCFFVGACISVCCVGAHTWLVYCVVYVSAYARIYIF